MLRELRAPDFLLADGLVRNLFTALAAHFRGKRDHFSGPSIQLLARIAKVLIWATRGSFVSELFRANPDVMHQCRQTPARQGLTVSLRHVLRCKACGYFGPRRTIFVMHALQFTEMSADDLSGASLDPTDRGIDAIGLKPLHVGLQTFQINLHGSRLTKAY
jgi:hypothetical protein